MIWQRWAKMESQQRPEIRMSESVLAYLNISRRVRADITFANLFVTVARRSLSMSERSLGTPSGICARIDSLRVEMLYAWGW